MLSEAQVAWDIHIADESEPSRHAKLPQELSLENIIKNKTLSPCSFNEFMDYLVCEEENAELLQFFTWFCGYVERWSQLSPQEKLLSPPWNPNADKSGRAGSALTVRTLTRNENWRLNQILEILDPKDAMDQSSPLSNQRREKTDLGPMNFSKPRRPLDSQTSRLNTDRDAQVRKNLLPDGEVDRFLNQPFRHEVRKVVKHYLDVDAPRRLKIPHDDLAACLDAVETTTHPSALLPAFTPAETILKSSSHPAFIRQAQRNANQARLMLDSIIGITLILTAITLDALLVLSSLSPFLRIAALVLFWPGFTILVAAAKGICVFLHVRGLRQLRLWEGGQYMAADKGYDDDDCDSYSSSTNEIKKTHIDPLRKPCMQTYGEANRLEKQARLGAYKSKSLVSKVRDETVKTHNPAVRALQKRAVWAAVGWGGVVATALTVGTLWIPAVGLFF